MLWPSGKQSWVLPDIRWPAMPPTVYHQVEHVVLVPHLKIGTGWPNSAKSLGILYNAEYKHWDALPIWGSGPWYNNRGPVMELLLYLIGMLFALFNPTCSSQVHEFWPKPQPKLQKYIVKDWMFVSAIHSYVEALPPEWWHLEMGPLGGS